jgi:hypothetical protein
MVAAGTAVIHLLVDKSLIFRATGVAVANRCIVPDIIKRRRSVVRHDAEVSIQDPAGMKAAHPCPSCRYETSHSVLSIVNSHHYEGLAQFFDNYVTVRCNGCGTISFCHVSRCSEEEGCDEDGRPFLIPHKNHYPAPQVPEVATGSVAEPFIETSRIAEIKALAGGQFDTSRLVQMLIELNRAYQSDSFLSCAILIRSIIDHVPPIFDSGGFSEIANNYNGGRSFRESMQNLDKSLRKIADSYLHTHIRRREIMPTKAQIAFRPDLDVLLAEIIRAWKH